jgi:hypothetical protein
MGDKMFKRYRRAIGREMDKHKKFYINTVMHGLFALSRPKRIAVALQLAFGRKKWKER